MFGLRNGGVADWMLAHLLEPAGVDVFLSLLMSELIFAWEKSLMHAAFEISRYIICLFVIIISSNFF